MITEIVDTWSKSNKSLHIWENQFFCPYEGISRSACETNPTGVWNVPSGVSGSPKAAHLTESQQQTELYDFFEESSLRLAHFQASAWWNWHCVFRSLIANAGLLICSTVWLFLQTLLQINHQQMTYSSVRLRLSCLISNNVQSHIFISLRPRCILGATK